MRAFIITLDVLLALTAFTLGISYFAREITVIDAHTMYKELWLEKETELAGVISNILTYNPCIDETGFPIYGCLNSLPTASEVGVKESCVGLPGCDGAAQILAKIRVRLAGSETELVVGVGR